MFSSMSKYIKKERFEEIEKMVKTILKNNLNNKSFSTTNCFEFDNDLILCCKTSHKSNYKVKLSLHLNDKKIGAVTFRFSDNLWGYPANLNKFNHQVQQIYLRMKEIEAFKTIKHNNIILDFETGLSMMMVDIM